MITILAHHFHDIRRMNRGDFWSHGPSSVPLLRDTRIALGKCATLSMPNDSKSERHKQLVGTVSQTRPFTQFSRGQIALSYKTVEHIGWIGPI